MLHRIRHAVAPAVAVALLAAPPAVAQIGGLPGELPIDLPPIDLPGVDPPPTDPLPVDPLPTDPLPVDPLPVDPLPVDPLPVDPLPTDPLPVDPLPVDLPPVDPPGETLPGGLPGLPAGDSPSGGSTAGGSGDDPVPNPALGGSEPVISGPSRAPTAKVDAKGRFRLQGVSVGCPELSVGACTLVVKLTASGGGPRFVKRAYVIRSREVLSLTKLKLTGKGLKALRSMRVARVSATISAVRPGGAPAQRTIGLKLKAPGKRR